ncbi:hypothetical protein H6P81_000315 [Aristolochia fimbriata]|uniref:Uncharacterized protein n=1 Tax=Aristolochia fimbriata TaxID=158543 RepID=A0AAV7F7P9_ARIFI|nr:hypothetical protein H6P81_000315 [Aristolochia fimbriata]
MSSGRQTVKDLVEEAKKRIVLLVVCVVGLSYLMSLTSSSVWVNLPAAASLILFLRYISYDLDMRRRAAAYKSVSSTSNVPLGVPSEGPRVADETLNWRRKVNSPVVEAAIDKFTRHLVSEWVTDLWYSRLSPDKDAPEELVNVMNGVLGEISFRIRDVNLIDLLSRDIINLICNNLELYRTCQAKLQRSGVGQLTLDQWNVLVKQAMVSDNKLHPALISAEAEHRVLQQLMEGLMHVSFRPEDLQCSFFRYTVRELLVCAVIRPVLNMANPRFINEKIENVALSIASKNNKGDSPAMQNDSQTKKDPSKAASDSFSLSLDQTNKGLELVSFKQNESETTTDEVKQVANGRISDSHSAVPRSSLSSDSQNHNLKEVQVDGRSGDWGKLLDIISERKTQALAPEHFDNMWAKGRNYKKKETVSQSTMQPREKALSGESARCKVAKTTSEKNPKTLVPQSIENSCSQGGGSSVPQPLGISQEVEQKEVTYLNEVDVDTESSYPSEDDESSSVTGLDSPGTKVWDSKNNRNAVGPHIRHPLENIEGNLIRKGHNGPVSYSRLSKGRKRSRSSNQKLPIWQEVERSSFLLGDGRDILNASKVDIKSKEDDSESDGWGRVHSGAAASSSSSSISTSEGYVQSGKSSGYSVLADSFLRLRCEVLGANIVKSGSSTFAVYSISVTDANNNNWSIKRRFRHFEDLHRRLKEFPEYNLHLPPKHFLSPGLDISVVQARCKLLDTYLKKLLQLPNISRSIEVWDFLSVDSQTYVFSNSLSIIETLSVDLDAKAHDKSPRFPSLGEELDNHVILQDGASESKVKQSGMPNKQNHASDGLKSRMSRDDYSTRSLGNEYEKWMGYQSESDSDSKLPKVSSSVTKTQDTLKNAESVSNGLDNAPKSLLEVASDPTLPSEWIPPNLSIPILNLVDVVFQLQDGGWIRRQVFWVAKQVLQLGMGDAFDDWLIEKIQLLRKGSVIASIINRIEQILWPDGIFLTKHPKRRRPHSSVTGSQSPGSHSAMSPPRSEGPNSFVSELEAVEAARRAKFVRELMIDNAPAALVSLVGRKEYQRCAQDVYFFLQSPVCLKQLALELLELLLTSVFPELQDVVKRYYEEKEKFGQAAV